MSAEAHGPPSPLFAFAFARPPMSLLPSRDRRVERATTKESEVPPYQEVRSVFDVSDLVDDLHNLRRSHAVVVVTPKADGTYPYDAVAISEGVQGTSVKVYRFEDPDLTYDLSDKVSHQLSVFEGAARLYPRGVAWLNDKMAAPLMFATDDAEKISRRQYTLIKKAREFSTLPNRVSPATAEVAVPARASIAPGITPRALASHPEEPTPAPSEADQKNARQLDARDETIRERDATISDLQKKLGEESDRVSRISELYITAQENDRQARARAATAIRRERELLRENADLQRKLSEAHEARRTQVKNAKARVTVTTVDGPLYRSDLFPDIESATRFAIQCAWAEWVPPSEKPTHPLPDYTLGERFAQSLDALDAQLQSKALRAVVSVLTGLAVEKRQVHTLRVNSAAPPTTRVKDGATWTCYRAYIEENVPAARRLHYWKLPDGTVELSRIVVHDDYEP